MRFGPYVWQIYFTVFDGDVYIYILCCLPFITVYRRRLARAMGMQHWYLVACVLLSVLSLACGQCNAGQYANDGARSVKLKSLVCTTWLHSTYVLLGQSTYDGYPVYKHSTEDMFLWKKNQGWNRWMISSQAGRIPAEIPGPNGGIQVFWDGNFPVSNIQALEWCGVDTWQFRNDVLEELTCLPCQQTFHAQAITNAYENGLSMPCIEFEWRFYVRTEVDLLKLIAYKKPIQTRWMG